MNAITYSPRWRVLVLGCALFLLLSPASGAVALVQRDLCTEQKAFDGAVHIYQTSPRDGEAVAGSERYLVVRPDIDMLAERGEMRFSPRAYLVGLIGERFIGYERVEEVNPILLDPNITATGGMTAHLYQGAAAMYSNGYLGYARVDAASGRGMRVIRYGAVRPHLGIFTVNPDDAREIAASNMGIEANSVPEPILVELFLTPVCWWIPIKNHDCFIPVEPGGEDDGERPIEAMVLNEADTAELLAKIYLDSTRAAPDEGRSTYRDLTQIFLEQGMHEEQAAGTCGSTSVAMVFDYFGEHIWHIDATNVATRVGYGPTGAGMSKTAMFSKYSVQKWNRYNAGFLDGYNERPTGYSNGRAYFTGDNGDRSDWNALKELIDEKCPFVVHIIPDGAPAGHYVVVVGYEEVSANEHNVFVADPSGDADADPQEDKRLWEDGSEGEGEGDEGFKSMWDNAGNRAEIVEPMPIKMNLFRDEQAGTFTIRATVWTCHEWPEHGEWAGFGQRYYFVNGKGNDVENEDAADLKGDIAGAIVSGNENLTVTLSYPPVLTKAQGCPNDTVYWDPSYADDSETFEWTFIANGLENGLDFEVEVRGFASDYDGRDGGTWVGYLVSAMDTDDTTFALQHTTLTSNITYEFTGGTIYVANASVFPAGGVGSDYPIPGGDQYLYVLIDAEVFRIEGIDKTNNTLTVDSDVPRPQFLSTRAAHDTGADVWPFWHPPGIGQAWTAQGDSAFLVRVDDELMRIKQLNGETFTFTIDSDDRGFGATSPEAHSAGAFVALFDGDEIAGYAHLRIDEDFLRVKNSAGDTIFAVGDKGNVYMDSSDFSQQMGTLTPNGQHDELLVKDYALNTLLKIDQDDGTVMLKGFMHGSMDDWHDTVDDVNLSGYGSHCAPMQWNFWRPWRLYEAILNGTQNTIVAHEGNCTCEEGFDRAWWWLSPSCPFYVRIGQEILKVTSIDEEYPCRYHVDRHQLGTTAAPHPAKEVLYLWGKGTLSSDIEYTHAATIYLTEGDLEHFPLDFLPKCFHIKIDDEILMVTGTGYYGNTPYFSVLRGKLGTTAATHDEGADVTLKLFTEQYYRNKLRSADGLPWKSLKVLDEWGDAVFSLERWGDIRHKGIVLPLAALPPES